MKSLQENILTFILPLKDVLGRPGYIVLAVTIFLAVMLFAVWLPNLSFVLHVATSPTLAFSQKVGILGNSLGAIQTNFTPLSRIFTVAVALLFAAQFSMIVFYLKRRISLQKAAGIGSLGMLSGLLGVGCAACGSVILSALFGVGATASFIEVLPLKGQEFGLLSIAILVFALFLTARKIQDPLVCSVESSKVRASAE